mgnify:CR=1 FL=1
MIYTVTLNPSIDYVIELDSLNHGSVNRVNEENIYPGGKGINVSNILNELGYKNIALGFISGFTGKYIVDSMIAKNLNCDFIELSNGFTRINVKIKSNEETEVNGNGPNISEEDLQKLINLLILETSTFGVRYHKLERTVIDRKFERINTKYGDIQIKLGYLNNKLIKATPEYEDCKIMAKRENIPLVKVFQEINYLIAEKFF